MYLAYKPVRCDVLFYPLAIPKQTMRNLARRSPMPPDSMNKPDLMSSQEIASARPAHIPHDIVGSLLIHLVHANQVSSQITTRGKGS
jgi:hypothetical protein